MVLDAVQLPKQFNCTLISSGDTNPIAVAPAVSGSIVRLWGLVGTGGTSVTVKSNTTAVTGAIATTGIILPPPGAGNPITDVIAPWAQSVAGETINIVPAASGFAGYAIWTY